MKPTKAYILTIDTDLSKEYARCAVESCERVGLDWEYFKGYKTNDRIWEDFPVKSKSKLRVTGAGGAATAGHIHIWHKIANSNECSIILEHDAIMLHKPEIDIPDDMMVVLGYKVKDPHNYLHEEAGPPQKIEMRKQHGGAHAYAITPRTAQILINHIETHGLTTMIDNHYFLRQGASRRHHNHVPMGIVDPICALGWLRESTIWNKAAVDNYRPLLDSFKNHYKSSEDLGLKG